jgi:hypothetical protein
MPGSRVIEKTKTFNHKGHEGTRRKLSQESMEGDLRRSQSPQPRAYVQ